MKKILFSLTFFLAYSIGYSQMSTKDVFKQQDLVWYGLDFSKARFIGQFDQGVGIAPANGFDIKTKWIPNWNGLVVSEPKNFDFKRAFWKTSIYNDLKPVEVINTKIDVGPMMSMNSYTLSKEEAQKAVASYGAGDKTEGLGLVFVVESFDKPSKQASYWVIFFDIKTKKILLCEYCKGSAVGIGMRNFWAGTIKNTLKEIANGKFAEWEKFSGK